MEWSTLLLPVARRSRPRPALGLAAGAVGGLAGAMAMNLVHAAWERIAKPTYEIEGAEESATTKAARRIARGVLRRPLRESEKSPASSIVHYATGAVSGAIFGMADELMPRTLRRSALDVPRGLVFGTAMWAAADEALAPALGLAKSPLEYPWTTHVRALVAHLVYGVTTSLARRALMRLT